MQAFFVVTVLRFVLLLILNTGSPGSSAEKKSPAKAGDVEFDSWVWKVPWRRTWQPTPIFLPWKSHEQRSLVGYVVHGVTKNLTQLSD